MPRGIPNVKRDESQGMRYTTFHVPPQYVPIAPTMTPLPNLCTPRLNPKHMSTSYLKSESNTMWGRKAARGKTATDEPQPDVRLAPRHLTHLLRH